MTFMNADAMAGHLLLGAVFFQFLFLQESSSSAIASSCRITPVEEGGTAVVTCNFDKNIKETMDGFQVDRYSTMDKTQETLLACQWISDQLECQHHDRVIYDGTITNTFKIHIPSVTSIDVGKYVCYVLPILNGTIKSCSLNLIDNNTTAHHVTSTTDSSIIKELAAIRDAIEEAGRTNILVLSVPAMANLVIITANCIILLILIRKYSRKRDERYTRRQNVTFLHYR